MTSYLTTLGAIKTQLSAQNGNVSPPIDDPIMAAFIPVASQMIEDYCGNSFCPLNATRSFSVRVGGSELHLKDNLALSVTALMNVGGSVIDPSCYVVQPLNEWPKRQIVLKIGTFWLTDATLTGYDNVAGFDSQSYSSPLISPIPFSNIADRYVPEGVSVTGVWGYHSDYLNAWQPTGLTVADVSGMTIAQKTLTLSSTVASGGLDVGSFLQIDSEYLAITGPIANTGAATIVNVVRAQNGSAAATHANGSAIRVWVPESVPEFATRALVCAMYKRRDNASGDTVTVDGLGTAKLTARSIPQFIKDLLETRYRNFYGGSR